MSAIGSEARDVSASPSDGLPARIADRYEVVGLLGKGGMAEAYRVHDTATGQHVALKLLASKAQGAKGSRDVELFEREYHTLVQLAHPRVVQAFEYGVEGERHYYTMELLDGGDLQALAPMRWQEVATAAYEICSALSMLHSRRLVHRDLTPRNVRRTADGKTKLMDFGLLSPMGPADVVAGTPPFVPPELVNLVSLDGRSDLFSLGATLYFALTGRHAFPARRFEQLRDTWRTSPRAPSKMVPDVPGALDALVLSMLRIDAGSRPKSAAEVMERLLPLLGSPPDDELRVASAHLTAPRLVGRSAILEAFRKRALRSASGHGDGFVIEGESGMGRSRMLDAFVLEAKLAGTMVARAGASSATVPFGAAATILAQLRASAPTTAVAAAQAQPEVASVLLRKKVDAPADGVGHEALEPGFVDVTEPGLEQGALQRALRAWVLQFAEQRAVAIAVDDFDEIDEASAALFASLTWEAKKHRLTYAFAVGSNDRVLSTSRAVIEQQAARVHLDPLELDETTELLASIFGDTANLQLLAVRLHALCRGRPRECIELAQFLVDRGIIGYSGGSFSLPAEIPEGVLPENVEAGITEQLSRLGSTARRVGALLSLELTERLGRGQLIRLLGAGVAVDAAIDELVAMRLITGDPNGYALRERTTARAFTTALSPEERRELHDCLSELEGRTVTTLLVIAYHQLLGKDPERGLDLILRQMQTSEDRTRFATGATDELGGARVATTLRLALSEATVRGRPRRDLQPLWVLLASVAALGEDARCFYDIPGEWLDSLKRETGWYDWQSLDGNLDPTTRAMMAVGMAAQRFATIPESERVLSPPDAIRQLVGYSVFAIALGVRVQDLELMAALPGLLEPFAPLDPTVRVMLTNARGTLLNGLGKREAARTLFAELLQEMEGMKEAPAYFAKITSSMYHTLAAIDASLGIASPFIERLAQEAVDPSQRVGARYLQKVAALNQGDWEAAERYRQQAELEMLQSRLRPMFSTLGQELEAHAMARDLTGVRQVRAAIQDTAREHPGWATAMHVADGHYHRLCGNLDAGLAAARNARATVVGQNRSPWTFHAAALETEILVELGRAEEARSIAEAALVDCEREGMRSFVRALSCAVALAEGKLGHSADALARLEGVIAEQTALGVTGLALGRSYECCARVAVWSSDVAAFDRFAKLAAEQYRPGHSSVLGALYERLMEEARQAGLLFDAPSFAVVNADVVNAQSASVATLTAALSDCSDRRTRAERALALLCDGDPNKRAHLLYLAEGGLQLVASRNEAVPPSEIVKFAHERIDMEIRPSYTVTGEPATDADSSAITFTARDGTIFTSTLLLTADDTGIVVAGVLVYEEGGTRVTSFEDLASAVARSAIDSGDALAARVS
jgi:serine/threonine-protein kinase